MRSRIGDTDHAIIRRDNGMRRAVPDRRFSQHTALFQIDAHQEIARCVRNVGSPSIVTNRG